MEEERQFEIIQSSVFLEWGHRREIEYKAGVYRMKSNREIDQEVKEEEEGD